MKSCLDALAGLRTLSHGAGTSATTATCVVKGDGQLHYSTAKMSKYRWWVPASSACRCSSIITQRNARSNDR
jgi:hypothetical protein